MLNSKNKQDILSSIKNGNSINDTDKFGSTLLHKAVVYGNVSLVKDLLELGANPRIKNMKGETPIFYLNKNKQDILKLFLENVGAVIYTDLNNEGKNYLATILK
jgi:ankyrin repeat protein